MNKTRRRATQKHRAKGAKYHARRQSERQTEQEGSNIAGRGRTPASAVRSRSDSRKQEREEPAQDSDAEVETVPVE